MYLTRKVVPFVDACEASFQDLKDMFVSLVCQHVKTENVRIVATSERAGVGVRQYSYRLYCKSIQNVERVYNDMGDRR